ncbi:polysaccharide pyruvyl transferase family protein [Desulfosporosinus sp. BG]|uniref:polysaccharide pyruvyl transferase family protein n=1 Tax=Desulfosporosinus sp. BG TaxID=1633135 RepID=UPI00083B38B3|nr:polysaccharide pyruvyl transferase family protein [Desulfosporosinus sp. BG]ODA39136.1 hypothetical protein DSBG_4080 [Desulfosporosinus sp. BG]
MKVGIITFQFAWNCGAVLQCVALQNAIEKMGHDVVIIDYRPTYKTYKYQKYQDPFKNALDVMKGNNGANGVLRAVKSFVRTVLDWKPNSGRSRQREGFQTFCNQHFHLTREYCSLEDIRNDAPKCDVYLTGSDQVWNPELTNKRLDGAYFLAFGDISSRRISYAVSACQLDVQKSQQELRDFLAQFDTVSLREVEKQADLQTVFSKPIEIVPDPTLLLKATDYTDFELNVSLPEKYILIYALENPETDGMLFKMVERAKKKYGLPIIVITGPHHWPYKVNFTNSVLPGEFLSYIKNAEYVITNSFHATTFSLIYRKQFVTMVTKGRASRVTELLNNIGLETRIVLSEDGIDDVLANDVDYEIANDRMEELKMKGINYLSKQLG